MNRWLVQGAIVIWALAATVVAVQAYSLAGAVEETGHQQTQVERELRRLKREHRELQTWVIDTFRPWVERQVEHVAEALPTPPPLDPAPVTPSPFPAPVDPTRSPSPIPEPVSPSPEPTYTPSPSEICLPIICPSTEGGEP